MSFNKDDVESGFRYIFISVEASYSVMGTAVSCFLLFCV